MIGVRKKDHLPKGVKRFSKRVSKVVSSSKGGM